MPLTRKTLPLTALALALTGASAVFAQSGPSEADKHSMLERAFGATIVSTYPDGREARLWLQRDGDYQMESRRHDHSDGHWHIKDDKLCLKQSHPFPAPFAFCTPAPATLDKPWTAKAMSGETITLRLIDPPKGPAASDRDQRKTAGEGRPPAG